MNSDEAIRLAMQHHQAGRLPEAEKIYRQVLAHQPEHVEALHLLGVLACQANQHHAGIELLQKAVSIQPNHATAQFNLGNALRSTGQLESAATAFAAAAKSRPNFFAAHFQLGIIRKDQRRLCEASDALQAAVRIKPDFAEAYFHLGNVQRDLREFHRAAESFSEAVRLVPGSAEGHNNLAAVLKELEKWDEAESAMTQAVRLSPNLPEFHFNLGNLHRKRGQFKPAMVAYQNAIRLRPDYAAAYNNLGRAFDDDGNPTAAAAAFTKAIELDPKFAEAKWNLALNYLMTGDFVRGWPLYESRWDFNPPLHHFAQPQWHGEDVTGKTILIHAEQGFGDTIQAARYLPLIAAQGARVLVVCQKELLNLLQHAPGVFQAATDPDALPAFDLHCPFMSLPLAFGTKLDSIPITVPYLHADAVRTLIWENKFKSPSPQPSPGVPGEGENGEKHWKVGLVWSGHPLPRGRSIPATTLTPLGGAKKIQWVSLQIAPDATPEIGLLDWTHELRDFADTAALISQLDLVVTIDTAIAHLAGALGKPTWVLLKFAPDWRWMRQKETCPWYPTMRLFRQHRFGDWDQVIHQVNMALQKLD